VGRDLLRRETDTGIPLDRLPQRRDRKARPVFLELPPDIIGISIPEESAPMPAKVTRKYAVHPEDADLKAARSHQRSEKTDTPRRHRRGVQQLRRSARRVYRQNRASPSCS
jgi:TPP-dependent 2-oxoacid decarboxylase